MSRAKRNGSKSNECRRSISEPNSQCMTRGDGWAWSQSQGGSFHQYGSFSRSSGGQILKRDDESKFDRLFRFMRPKNAGSSRNRSYSKATNGDYKWSFSSWDVEEVSYSRKNY